MDMSAYCRLCSGTAQRLVSLLGPSQQMLCKWVKNNLKIEFNDANGYPTGACLSCIELIGQWIIFCNRCRDSTLKFTTMMNTSEPAVNPPPFLNEPSTSAAGQSPPSSLILHEKENSAASNPEMNVENTNTTDDQKLSTENNPNTESISSPKCLTGPQNSTSKWLVSSSTLKDSSINTANKNQSCKLLIKNKDLIPSGNVNECYILKDLRICLKPLVLTPVMLQSINQNNKRKKVRFDVPRESDDKSQFVSSPKSKKLRVTSIDTSDVDRERSSGLVDGQTECSAPPLQDNPPNPIECPEFIPVEIVPVIKESPDSVLRDWAKLHISTDPDPLKHTIKKIPLKKIKKICKDKTSSKKTLRVKEKVLRKVQPEDSKNDQNTSKNTESAGNKNVTSVLSSPAKSTTDNIIHPRTKNKKSKTESDKVQANFESEDALSPTTSQAEVIESVPDVATRVPNVASAVDGPATSLHQHQPLARDSAQVFEKPKKFRLDVKASTPHAEGSARTRLLETGKISCVQMDTSTESEGQNTNPGSDSVDSGSSSSEDSSHVVRDDPATSQNCKSVVGSGDENVKTRTDGSPMEVSQPMNDSSASGLAQDQGDSEETCHRDLPKTPLKEYNLRKRKSETRKKNKDLVTSQILEEIMSCSNSSIAKNKNLNNIGNNNSFEKVYLTSGDMPPLDLLAVATNMISDSSESATNDNAELPSSVNLPDYPEFTNSTLPEHIDCDALAKCCHCNFIEFEDYDDHKQHLLPHLQTAESTQTSLNSSFAASESNATTKVEVTAANSITSDIKHIKHHCIHCLNIFYGNIPFLDHLKEKHNKKIQVSELKKNIENNENVISIEEDDINQNRSSPEDITLFLDSSSNSSTEIIKMSPDQNRSSPEDITLFLDSSSNSSTEMIKMSPEFTDCEINKIDDNKSTESDDETLASLLLKPEAKSKNELTTKTNNKNISDCFFNLKTLKVSLQRNEISKSENTTKILPQDIKIVENNEIKKEMSRKKLGQPRKHEFQGMIKLPGEDQEKHTTPENSKQELDITENNQQNKKEQQSKKSKYTGLEEMLSQNVEKKNSTDTGKKRERKRGRPKKRKFPGLIVNLSEIFKKKPSTREKSKLKIDIIEKNQEKKRGRPKKRKFPGLVVSLSESFEKKPSTREKSKLEIDITEKNQERKRGRPKKRKFPEVVESLSESFEKKPSTPEKSKLEIDITEKNQQNIKRQPMTRIYPGLEEILSQNFEKKNSTPEKSKLEVVNITEKNQEKNEGKEGRPTGEQSRKACKLEKTRKPVQKPMTPKAIEEAEKYLKIFNSEVRNRKNSPTSSTPVQKTRCLLLRDCKSQQTSKTPQATK